MRPDETTFGELLAVVLEHLPTLLGERLFMTVARGDAPTVVGDGAAAVLAIDAAGDPVVVQAVPVLGAHHLVVALRGAGRASGVTRRALAAAYAQGPDHFHSDLASFFDHDGAPRSAGSGRASRLVLVCSEIADDAVEAVSFLSGDPARVQVLTVGAVTGASGSRVVGVSSLRPGELGALETISLALDAASPSDGPEPQPDLDPDPHSAPVSERAAHPAPQPLTAFGRTEPYAPRPRGPGSDRPRRGGPLRERGQLPEPTLLAPTPNPTPAPAPAPEDPGPPDARLSSLARTLSTPLDLVWVRHRRGERLEVVLGLDGLLHAPDGMRYPDPDAAVRALSGSSTSSGWRVWRAGESGPSLDELAPGAQVPEPQAPGPLTPGSSAPEPQVAAPRASAAQESDHP